MVTNVRKNRYQKNKGLPCKGPKCTRNPVARQMCDTHYRQWLKHYPLTEITPYKPRQPVSKTPVNEAGSPIGSDNQAASE